MVLYNELFDPSIGMKVLDLNVMYFFTFIDYAAIRSLKNISLSSSHAPFFLPVSISFNFLNSLFSCLYG